MPARQQLVTYGVSTVAAATITAAALLQPWRAVVPQEAPREPGMPRVAPAVVNHPIDVVFAVDTTGSMGGLLDGAKRTVWSIATHIRQTDPNAELRIGLVAYRDIGDEYVTRDFALTSDLDAVFAELSGYQAAGGGDEPEDVDAALDDSLHKMQWRGDAKKLVFLVGDAPPASRGDVPRFDVLAREAGDKQIILNTIRCGGSPTTQVAWQRIAALGHGQFSSIGQDGGVHQIATPYDDKLAELSDAIDHTAVIVGDDRRRLVHEFKMSAAAKAPAAAKADRATYYATKPSKGRVATREDLVEGVASGTMAVEAMAPAALPAELRGLDKPALKLEVDRRIGVRKAAEGELAKVARQRDEYLRSQAKAGAGSAAGFDAQVNAALDAQLK
jgi:hypothetical protein